MKKLKLLIYGCLMVMFITSCRKQEFTLPPEGEKVSYTDTLRFSRKELLEKSPAKLFLQAWKRSNIENILKSVGNAKSTFTVLVPSDAAMENAGLTSEKILAMQVKDLDSLMMLHTLSGTITAQDIENRTDNYVAGSILTKAGLRVLVSQSSTAFGSTITPYYYQQRLQVKNGKTYVNGRVVGSGKFMAAKDGYLWMLDQVLVKPEKTILQVLKEDGRFTMLLGILQYTDEQYTQIIEEGGVYNGAVLRPDFVKRYNWGIIPTYPWDNSSVNLIRSTALLPDDEAFRNAGFNNLEDLKEFNRKRGLPYVGEDEFGSKIVIGNYATDSLLTYHLDLGVRFNSRNAPVQYVIPFSFGFCTNEMTNPVMSDFLVGVIKPKNMEDYMVFYMPFDFSRDASGRVQVKLKEVPDGTTATIIRADIPTLMGPIHVVDHFLTPKGFKINQK